MLHGIRQALGRLDAAAGLGAVVARDDPAALRAAAELDAQGPGGSAVWGLPVTVKDWIDVAGLPCLGASADWVGRIPDQDATVVARLRAAGAIVVAKTHPGPVHPVHGECRHPADASRSPGGSSSGEAALLGAGATRVGIGSDSGGSIRLPAAWCGVAGLRPSSGLVPLTGHFPPVGPRADGRTVIGPLASRVADLGRVLAVIAGPDGADGGCVPVPLRHPDRVQARRLRIAVVGGEGTWRPAASTLAAVGRAGAALARRGALLLGEVLPAHLEESLDITQRYWNRRRLTGAQADRQLADWDRLATRFAQVAADLDVVIGPVVRDIAPVRRRLTGADYIFTLPWSLTGWPAVSVPAGPDPATGLPLAVQVAAPRFHDHVALAVAGWIESDLAPGTPCPRCCRTGRIASEIRRPPASRGFGEEP